ncbi:hypothetical protein EVAR_17008_1 [Eumeta japonica]|uniref:Uncharacterized protein n=1 Tax=Eumeta variegata TaxID=151549 RepID=A0A4C1TVJ6_EUMVA|nr:hypothetical protein EVAR_17008_1 [Eumeta japonica]
MNEQTHVRPHTRYDNSDRPHTSIYNDIADSQARIDGYYIFDNYLSPLVTTLTSACKYSCGGRPRGGAVSDGCAPYQTVPCAPTPRWISAVYRSGTQNSVSPKVTV